MKPHLILIFLLFTGLSGFSQNYSLQITISNQLCNSIEIGKVRGDRFIFLDSIHSEGFTSIEALTKKFIYHLPEHSTPGMYRLILGQTRYAEIMNEPPQQLDFIFNNENIELETDFKDPDEKIRIQKSEENEVWFPFKSKEKLYRQYLNRLKQQINSGQQTDSELKEKREEYNISMMDREVLINETVQKNQNLFAARIIKMYHEPLVDAYLSEKEGLETYINEYFNNIDFTDESLINSSIYTDKVIHFIQSFGQYGLSREQQEQEFIKAVDIVFSHVNKNQAVFEFILDYIVRGFEKLNLGKALIHIAENYGETTCLTDEKTTLQRRLDFQKMKPGTQTPDFTMNDINDDPVKLSEVTKPKTLILFWASWCPHCAEMIPEIKKLESKIEVIAVSIDSIITDWQNKVFDLGIESWYNLSDLKGWNGQVTNSYNIYATPTMFLVDENRKIIAKPFDLFELKEELK